VSESGNTVRGEKLIIGLGKTGLSCARYFSGIGQPFRVMDSRFSPPALGEFRREFPDVEVELGGFNRDSLHRAGELVLSPGVGLATPEIAEAVASGIPVVGDIDIFSRHAGAPIIAVTGSNGKSTVVTLLGEMARTAGIHVGVGGNLDGRASMPALDLLRDESHQLYVLELSSFQLETTHALGADVATILNISEDHLDRYPDMPTYLAAKQRIYRGCRKLALNRDAKHTWPDPLPDEARLITYGLDAPSQDADFGVREMGGEPVLCRGQQALMSRRELLLVGEHNLANALAALALGARAQLPMEAMLTVLREFGGLPHRCQRIRTLRDVAFFNDSKGTNVGASLVAIRSVAEEVDGRLVLIAGGVDKNADFSPLLPALRDYVRHVVLIGRDAQHLAEIMATVVAVSRAGTMGEAVGQAMQQAQAGDAVLLSPACASYDMFKDFSHRGRVFVAAVEALH